MFFNNLCILVLLTRVASVLEGLRGSGVHSKLSLVGLELSTKRVLYSVIQVRVELGMLDIPLINIFLN